MKKSLIALAVLSALAGTSAAQTNVAIYGVVDVGISRTDVSNGAATWGMDSGVQSGSRLGFKGTEDLGGGMSASFNLENGYAVDTGAMSGGLLFGRQAWVALNGGYGTVRLGRQFTPIFQVLDDIDPFGTGLSGAINNVFSTYGVRMNNTVKYLTPQLNGFSGQLAYGFGEVAGNTSASRHLGASVGYVNGPLNVQFAYHDANNATDTGSTNTALLAGMYDFRVVKLHAAFATNGDDTTGAASKSRSRDVMLGVSAPVGSVGTVLASWIRHDQRSGAVGGVDRDQWAIGYLHSLSKRTNLYTSYGRLNLKPAGSADVSAFYAGIRHKF
ncbi:porin [Noviherbaspirillum sp.]|uniref:porin n=1 Tax=Noviherbaspirillum sp. TaxID=1926288 RepID=UPI002B4827D7|nr:porin [Noviherbaspirillum sp.]HJV83662.1 porin [Noviherbaspirillum sp.]